MTDSVLIVGGGIVGITTAQRCSAAGAKAVIVERAPVVGGRIAAALMPQLSSLDADPNIEILTLAELQAVEGIPGNFDVSIREKARFVTDACTRCNHCRPVCPEVLPNEFQAGLSYRKAIYTPHVETLPHAFVIDIEACLNTPPNYLPCNRCTEVCDDDAIHFDIPLDQLHERKVAAIVVATGFGDVAPPAFTGYGDHPDIVTAYEMECLLTAPGPTGGFAARPSNEDYPDSVALILDELGDFAVQTTASQVARLLEQKVENVLLLVTEKPGGDDGARLLETLPAGVDIRFGLLQSVKAEGSSGITVSYADFETNEVPEAQYDIVVLGADAGAPNGLAELAEILGVDSDADGFIAVGDDCSASRTGVYVAGGRLAKNDALVQAQTAAAAALSHLDPRLLRGGAVAAAGEVSESAPAPSEAELRARIERALFAMLDSGD